MKGICSLRIAGNSRGQLLLNLMIVISISAILISSVLHMINVQNQSLMHYQQKADAIELKANITAIMNSQNACTSQFKDLVIDTSMPDPSGDLPNVVIPIASIYNGVKPDAPILAEVGQVLSPFSNLKVQSIEILKVRYSGVPDKWIADLRLSFDDNSTVRTLAPVHNQVTFLTNGTDPANAKRIVSCAPVVSGCYTVEQDGVATAPFPAPFMIDKGADNLVDPLLVVKQWVYGQYPGNSNLWGLTCLPEYATISCNSFGYDTGNISRATVPGTSEVGCFGGMSEGAKHAAIQLTCCKK